MPSWLGLDFAAQGQDHLRWSRFEETAPEQTFATVKDQVFPFIKALGSNSGEEAEGDSTYSHHMKDALFMMPTPRVLANVADQLDGIDIADSDTNKTGSSPGLCRGGSRSLTFHGVHRGDSAS